jgi:hypothetical protein
MMNDNDITAVIDTNFSNEKTVKAYMSRLRTLKNVVMDGMAYYDIISNPDTTYPKLRDYYPNITTRKNVMTVILSVLKYMPQLPELQNALSRWKELHDYMDRFQKAELKKHIPNAKQLSQYTSLNDIVLKYNELGNNPITSLTKSIEYITLSIISSTPPKRADYGTLKVFYDCDPKLKINYIVVNTDTPSYIVLNIYKTSNLYDRHEQELPTGTTNDIKTSLKLFPREYLIVNRFGNPFATNDAYSKYIKTVFVRLFGKETGVTMLRHVYITEKLNFEEMDDNVLESEAKAMLQSTYCQRQYRWIKSSVQLEN